MYSLLNFIEKKLAKAQGKGHVQPAQFDRKKAR